MQKDEREAVKAQLDKFFPEAKKPAQDTGNLVKIHVEQLSREDIVNLTFFDQELNIKRSGFGLTIIIG